MRRADGLRYGLWGAVAITARRNRREYGVPTAWLTHLAGNTATLLLPELIRLSKHLPLTLPAAWQPIMRTIERRVCADPRYAGFVAPLALGFVTSYPEISIYHGRWAERNVLGFGVDSIPHSSAAYALARLSSLTIETLAEELPPSHALTPITHWSADHVDAIATAAVTLITLIWEISEYIAHQAELAASGRDASEINMQWSLPDAITDSISNFAGLAAAIAVRHREQQRVS